MAVLIFCSKCKQYFSQKHKKCPKCKKDLKRADRFWIILRLSDGTHHREVVHGNLTFARDVEDKIKSDIRQKKFFGIKKAPYIKDVWKQFHDWHQKYKTDTASVLSRWRVHIEPYIPSDLRMDQLSLKDVEKIKDRMMEKGGRDGDGCAPATINHVTGIIKRLYNWASKRDLYDGKNPADKLKPLKFFNEITNVLTDEHEKKLSNVLKHWKNQTAALIIKFALFTGCRRGEIFKLTWDDVDLENEFLKLRDPKGTPTIIPICKEACDVVIEAQKINWKSKYVFANRFGDKREQISNIWNRIKLKAKLPNNFRFHDLRHTFASKLVSSGVPLYVVQKLLNHQSPAMTQRYAHLSDKAMRNAVNHVGGFYNFD